MNTHQKIIFNTFLDWKKKEIDKYERAILILEYLKNNQLSQRQLAKQLGIHHNTLQDWLLYGRLTQEEFEQMKKTGLSSSEIYRILRSNKNKPNIEFKDLSKLDLLIEETRRNFNALLLNGTLTNNLKSSDNLKDLINLLNRVLMRIDK